jgi:hypothetical protein
MGCSKITVTNEWQPEPVYAVCCAVGTIGALSLVRTSPVVVNRIGPAKVLHMEGYGHLSNLSSPTPSLLKTHTFLNATQCVGTVTAHAVVHTCQVVGLSPYGNPSIHCSRVSYTHNACTEQLLLTATGARGIQHTSALRDSCLGTKCQLATALTAALEKR